MEQQGMFYEDFLDLAHEDIFLARQLMNKNKINVEKYFDRISKIESDSKSCYTFSFSIGGKRVTRENPLTKWDAVEPRANIVFSQLKHIANLITLPNLRILYEFEDMARDFDVPVISYHKKIDYSGIILVPDFEIHEKNYYCEKDYMDNLIFEEKINKAIFAGSTTGTNRLETRECQNTRENIDNDPSVRIDAAKYFSENRSVVFRLPSIVQCDSDATEAYIRIFPFADARRISWCEQLNYKFLISVDGNGPTLSRVALALLSNSVLMKYNSSWITYYHRLLVEKVNYIPIQQHSDIENSLATIPENIDSYKDIAKKSKEKFSLIFKRANVIRHYATILNEFRAMFFGYDDVYAENKNKINAFSHLDIDAHFSNVGDRALWPSLDVFDAAGNQIEGIAIYPSSSLFEWYNLRYQVLYENGEISDLMHGGQFVGTRGHSRGLSGFRMKATSDQDFQLSYTGVFSDGTIQRADNGNWIENVPAKLVRIVFYLLLPDGRNYSDISQEIRTC